MDPQWGLCYGDEVWEIRVNCTVPFDRHIRYSRAVIWRNNNERRIDTVFTSFRYLERRHHQYRRYHSTWLASRSRLYSAYKRQSERSRFFSCFCSSVGPFTLGSISPSFFFYTSATRAIVEFQRGTSFRNPCRWRRGFAGTKTFLRRLKSHSTRLLFFSPARLPWNGKLFGFLFSSDTYNRRRVGSRYRTRSRSFALHVDLAVNSWISSITGFNSENLRNVFATSAHILE